LLYGIEPAYWHRGLATEASSAILKYGFDELSFKRIEASTDAGNQTSVRVMQRLGMTFWKRELTNGLDTIYYAISLEDSNRATGSGDKTQCATLILPEKLR
jgi:RimJ/RimL family protein N-acetyltransferase